jgi:tetratricopeptide (TPR) repeat protein
MADPAEALYRAALQRLTSGEPAAAEADFAALLARHAAQGMADDDLACVLDDWADARNARGLWDAATDDHYRRALELLRAAHGEDHPDVANLLGKRSGLAHCRGRFAEAEAHGRRACAILERVLATIEGGGVEVDEETLHAIRHIRQQALTHLATALRGQARYAEAEPLCAAALAAARDLFGEEDRETGASLANLGALYKYWGRSDEAEAHYARARVLFEALPEDAPERADILYNLGGLAHLRERYAQAEPLSREALRLTRARLGDAHPDTAIKAMALGAVLVGLERHAEAEAHYREALQTFTATFGAEHTDVAVLHNNLGALLRETGRNAEAEVSYREALRLRERLLGPDHPQYALTLANLGVLLRETGREDEGADCLALALPVLVAGYGEGHPHSVACREAIGSARQPAAGSVIEDTAS